VELGFHSGAARFRPGTARFRARDPGERPRVGPRFASRAGMATIGHALEVLRDDLRLALGAAAGDAPWDLIEQLSTAGGAVHGLLAAGADEEAALAAVDVVAAMRSAQRALGAYYRWSTVERARRC